MVFNSPISSEKADRIIQLLGLTSKDRVLDAGCGCGEFLIRLCERSGAHGLGVDKDLQSIAAAREAAKDRISGTQCEFRNADITNVPLEPHSFDLALCIGSTHAYGSGDAAYPNTIDSFLRLVRAGGQLLIGEGYWKRDPAPEYLRLIGEPVGIYRDHSGNISFAEQHGLVPLYAAVSNDDEWDHFEWSHRMKMERQAVSTVADPAAAEKLERSRRWRDMARRSTRPGEAGDLGVPSNQRRSRRAVSGGLAWSFRGAGRCQEVER